MNLYKLFYAYLIERRRALLTELKEIDKQLEILHKEIKVVPIGKDDSISGVV